MFGEKGKTKRAVRSIARGAFIIYMLGSAWIFACMAKVDFPHRQPIFFTQTVETRMEVGMLPEQNAANSLRDWADGQEAHAQVSTAGELEQAVKAAQHGQQPFIADITGEIRLKQPLRIEAPVQLYLRGNGQAVIGAQSTRHIEILSGDVSLYFENVELIGGSAGGGISVSGGEVRGTVKNIMLAGLRITDCTAPEVQPVGGGLYVNMADGLDLIDCVISQCQAQWGGSGIYLAQVQGAKIGGNSVVSDCRTGHGQGAGIAVYQSDMQIAGNTRVEDNAAECSVWSEAACGGGIYSSESRVTLQENAAVLDNKACMGGGIYLSGGALEIKGHTRLEGNSALLSGGAVFSQGMVSVGGNTRMCDNLAGENGAGIYAVSGKITLQDDIFFDRNIALEQGGALWIGYEAAVTNVNAKTVFSGNVAACGNTVYFESRVPVRG